MKLTERVWLVGSGNAGLSMTHPRDCHVYLVDGGTESALIDAGIGLSTPELLDNIREAVADPTQVTKVLVTHPHADHAGGLARLREALGCQVLVAAEGADWVRTGDEHAIHLDFARDLGFYPADYRWQPCPVDGELTDGDEVPVGDLLLRVVATPGHSRGHLSFHFQAEDRWYLFGGDSVFWGGRILLQNIRDCVLEDYLATIRRLAELPVEVFLPGHRCFSLKDGARHLKKALSYTRRLGVPPNLE